MTLLKRYANRRLYDTRLSRYITLEDVAARIQAGEDFRVIDVASGEDLTRRVLLQVVLLEGLGIADVLPLEFLTTMIRLRDRRVRTLFTGYLGITLEAFTLAQRQMEFNLHQLQEQMQATATTLRQLFSFSAGEKASSRHTGDGQACDLERMPEPDEEIQGGVEPCSNDPMAAPWELPAEKARKIQARAHKARIKRKGRHRV